MIRKLCICVFVIIFVLLGAHTAFAEGILFVEESPASVQESVTPNSTDEDAGEKDKDSGDNTTKKPIINKDVISQIAMEFLGAFLGVLAAITTDKQLEKKQYKEINHSLYEELQKVYSDRIENEKADFYQYSTPIWDIYMASGRLTLLATGNIEKEYIQIYSKIQYAQSLEQEYIHSIIVSSSERNEFSKKYIDLINEAREREANNIIQMISALPKK